MQDAYREAGIEPSLAEALSDPLVLAVMRRDRVTVDEVWSVIRGVRDRLSAADAGARRRSSRAA